MTYDVRVPESIQQKIQSWNVSKAQLIEIFERLDGELAKRPLEVLRSSVAPIKFHQYSFRLTDDTHNRTVVFPVELQSDEKTFLVVGAWMMSAPVPRKVHGKTLPVSIAENVTE